MVRDRTGLFMYFFCSLCQYLRTTNIVSTKKAESLKLHCGKVSNTSWWPAGVDPRTIQCRWNYPLYEDITKGVSQNNQTSKNIVFNGIIGSTQSLREVKKGRSLSNTFPPHGEHNQPQFPHPMQLNLPES